MFLYREDIFGYNVVKNLEDIQKENPDKVEFTVFNAKGNLDLEMKFTVFLFTVLTIYILDIR